MSDTEGPASSSQPRLREAFERVRPELAGLERSCLLPLNLDPIAAACTVTAVIPRVRALTSTLEECLPLFDVRLLDRLELYALALIQAHSRVLCAKSPPQHLAALAAESIQTRANLMEDLAVLARRGLVTGVRPNVLRQSTSYRNLAADLLTLASLFRKDWDAISSRCGVTESELCRAEVLAHQLILVIGQRDRKPEEIAEALLDRQKIYTLCARAYDQVRRAMTFLRGERKDAADFVPSLYGPRKSRRAKGEVTVDKSDANNNIVAANTSEQPITDNVERAESKPAVGFPGSDPFLH